MLEIKNLTCGYGKNHVLSQISLMVGDAEFVGVIGPNGSGKTTLLRAITKIIPVQEGEIFFDQFSVKALGYQELAKKVAVVGHVPDSEISMSVFDFVLLGRTPFRQNFQFIETKEDISLAEQAMKLSDVWRFCDRPVFSLSAGERQLVLLAKALAQNPKLLILDEPTSHLDIGHQVAVLDLVKRLNREKKIAVIAVLHDLNLAAEYCDRLVLLNNGAIYKAGVPAEVLTYQVIEDVYRTCVVVKDNPVSKRPYVFLVSGHFRKQ